MKSCLAVSDTQIFSNLQIDRLQNWELLPELLRRIAIEDTIEQVADLESIDLNYTSLEFDQLLVEIKKSSAFQGMNISQLSAITERELKLHKFKQEKWGDRVETYFKSQGSGLDRVVISILQVADGSLAQELFFRIESGAESFAEIAIDYSQGKYAGNGGIVGPLLLRELAPSIANILTQLQLGKLSPLFEIDGHYTLFRLDQLSPAQLNERMKIFIVDELFNTWVDTEVAIPTSSAAIVTDRVVYYLSRSELLISYLQQLIIEEALAEWKITAGCEDLQAEQRGAELLQQYKLAKWQHLLKSQFLQFKPQIDRVLFSIVQVADLSLAQELYYQIGEQKHSFHKLATAYSQHPTATSGGIVGQICLSQLNPIIIQNLIGIAPKQLSGIFKLDQDYIFIRVERWLPGQYNEQIEQLLLDRLFSQWLQQQLRDRLDDAHSISFSPVVNLVNSQNGHNHQQPISIEPESEPEPEPTDTLSPTSSFFFPRVSPSGNVILTTQVSDDNFSDRGEAATTSSFFFPQQESSHQFISQPHNRRRTSVVIDRIIAFTAFFCLFLAGGIGLAKWLKTVDVDQINHADLIELSNK